MQIDTDSSRRAGHQLVKEVGSLYANVHLLRKLYAYTDQRDQGVKPYFSVDSGQTCDTHSFFISLSCRRSQDLVVIILLVIVPLV